MNVPSHWIEAEPASGRPLRGWSKAMPAVCEVMFASDGPCDPERVDWVCRQTRDFVQDVGGKGALVFRAGLFTTEWLAPIWSFKLPRFQGLDFETRLEVLERFERSPFGLSLLAVKLFLGIAYFEHRDTPAEIGFDGGPLLLEEE